MYDNPGGCGVLVAISVSAPLRENRSTQVNAHSLCSPLPTLKPLCAVFLSIQDCNLLAQVLLLSLAALVTEQ